MSRDELVTWVVYDHPSDYPNNYVAREWVVGPGQEPRPTQSVVICSDLERLRKVMLIDFGKVRLERSEGDDPTILETWL